MVGVKYSALVSAKPNITFEKIGKQDSLVNAFQDKLCDLAV